MPTEQATSEEIEAFLKTNPSWKITNEKLKKTFTFKDFVEAFSFMSQVAIVAERDDHHPEWFNVYKTVVVDLTTHDANGISAKDFSLAKAMDNIASKTNTST